MRRRIALVRAFVFMSAVGCSGGDKSDARETYDYLVTPAGQRFRLIGAGPVVRGANTRLGLRITYVAQALTKAELLAHADALVQALGPEMQLTGDTSLVVRARIGPASVALDSDKSTYDVEYRLGAQRFERVESDTRPPPLLASDQTDDPAFPFDEQQLTAAAQASRAWLAIVDEDVGDDDLDAMRKAVTKDFRAQIEDDAQLTQLLSQRKRAGLPGTRRELYRLQQRTTDKKRSSVADALIVYECTASGMPRTLERMTMSREADSWKVASYAFQPLPQR